ncbi:MAG: 50S ribosomal protein L9 [Saprospiraceae bacterium]|nr:50S ribosomal protein L9 [Saprospiraceae bacterium]
MDVILLQDLEKVGEKHTIVNVKDGFGRNYLIPRKLAIIANESNRQKLDELRAKEAEKRAKKLDEAQKIADKLASEVLKIGAKTGTSGKIFGSVTNIQIANAIEEQLGLDIDRKDIEIPEEVKVLGTYTAMVDLHPELEGKVTFEVVEE